MLDTGSHSLHKSPCASNITCLHYCIHSNVDGIIGGDNQCPITWSHNQYLSILVCFGVLCVSLDSISFGYCTFEAYMVRDCVVGFDMAGVGVCMGY
jgi:hypothetical protein